MAEFANVDTTRQDHSTDQTARHYKPAGKSPVCGASGRVYARMERGEEPDKYAGLKTPATTDINKVECPLCRRYIRRVAEFYGD